ncbi:hypothetical protein OV760_29050, partial [Salmonella enterica subsp. enterica serovar 1,4,[5],12:i:-]|nr:hypothetical protein [Salmonella enterica subsp. enterica serovar 1,4,[5],12:i:-]
VPVRYEMKGFNSLLGSHYDHYYLDYEDFSNESPSDDVFQVNPNVTCGGFPGPGVDHVYSFNPMKEFVHNHDEHLESSWNKFVKDHNKQYDEENNEHHKRKEIYRQNVRFI